MARATAADIPSMNPPWLVPGGACEVLMQEEGLWGSHYTAKILEVTKQKSKIEFEVRTACTQRRTLQQGPALSDPPFSGPAPGVDRVGPRPCRTFMRRARR